MSRDHGECEAVRLLRVLITGAEAQLAPAREQAVRLLRSYTRPGSERYACTRFSQETLREIARLRAERISHTEIGRRVGMSAQMVAYHLQPSGAMFDALLEKEGA